MELLGIFTNTLDAKKRVIFPAKYREDLGATFVITVNVDKCLSAYSLEEWETYTAKLKSLPKTQVKDITRFICGLAMKATPDSQGRIGLSKELVEYAGIESGVTFIGCGDRVEIWDERIAPVPSRYDMDKVNDIRDLMLEYGL